MSWSSTRATPTAAAALQRLTDGGAILTLADDGSVVPADWPRMERLVTDTRDWRAVTDSLRGRQVDGLLSFSHHFCSVAAAAAAALGVRGLDPDALRLCARQGAVRATLVGSPFTLAHRLLRVGDAVEMGPAAGSATAARGDSMASSRRATATLV